MMASSSNEPMSISTGGDKRNLKLMMSSSNQPMTVNSLKKEDPPAPLLEKPMVC
jgi:hypothetical protein